MLKSYVAFDIETTGLSPEHNEIIEIGALKVREGKVVDRFIRFIESEAGIPPMITQLTGITNDMVEGAGNCGEVLPEFLEFCEQDTLIGHNVQFDFSFVKTKAKELGYTYDHMGMIHLRLPKLFMQTFHPESLAHSANTIISKMQRRTGHIMMLWQPQNCISLWHIFMRKRNRRFLNHSPWHIR